MSKVIYLIGSLRNPEIPSIGNTLRAQGFEVFDDWHSAGPEADDHFKRYHVERGIPYDQALQGYAAQHIFNFDKTHLDRADMAILVMPAGRSGHLELGYMAGKGKPTFVLLEEGNDRWDLMLQFTNGIFFDLGTLIGQLCTSTYQAPCEELKTLTSQPFLKLRKFLKLGVTKYLTPLLGTLRNMGFK